MPVLNFLTTQDTSFQFSTIGFWAVFIVFFAFYLSVRKRNRALMMSYVICFGLLVSLKTNGWAMLFLPATALVSWAMTEKMKQAEGRRKRAWLTATVIIDLIPLIYLKYTDFLIGSLNSLIGSNFALQHLILPVGLSFYTFQAISYSVDVFKGKISYDVELLEYCFYITFFPLLFAGPIVRADTLVPQLRQRKHVSSRLVNTGFWLVVLGLLKKGLVADYIAEYNNWIFDDPTGYSGFEVLMGTIGFHVQLYCDFSGYSDMSIGLAAIMGLQLLPNFDFPYKSLNVTEFWRRWHISLSTWFRDYLYIPLGGNRRGEGRTYLNNFVTMLVAGLWHGASWMFVIWGAMHGAALVAHKWCKQKFLARIPDTKAVKVCSWLLTMIFVWAAWTIFRSKDMATVGQLFSQIFTDFSWDYLVPFVKARSMWTVFTFGALALHALVSFKVHDRVKTWVVDSHWIVKLIIFAVTVQLVINFSSDSVQPLLYTQF